MDYVIENVRDYDTFWKNMPELYCGKPYELNGEYDCDSERFIPEYFEFIGEQVQSGYLPNDLLPYVVRSCKELAKELKDEGFIQEDEYTYDDYLADRADKEEWKEK